MVGIVGYSLGGSQVSPEVLDSMAAEVTRNQSHLREEYRGKTICVAKVHLGVFKPKKQPVFDATGTVGILSDGMAYPQGASASGEDWLGLVLRSYREKGSESFATLNGSYSLVIFDESDGSVRLVSDRFATRPLYYWVGGGHFAFGGEAKAILKYPPYRKKLNPVALGKFFRFGRLGMWGDDTWFEGVKVLPPGSVLTVKGGEAKLEQYWDIDYSSPVREPLEETAKKLAESFRRSVALRTSEPSLKYSVALSGGLDSRVVLSACASNPSITAYTFGMKGSHELNIASRVARTLHSRHMVCAFDPEDAAKYVEEVVELADGNEVIGLSFLLLADKQFRDSVDVSIDGFALDLTLGGSFLRKNIVRAEGVPQLAALLERKFTLFSEAELKRALQPGFLEGPPRLARDAFVRLVAESKGDTMADKADYFALKTRVRSFTVQGHVLTRNYFEDTIPTYDNEFMELVTKIPSDLRFQYKAYKRFLAQLSKEMADIPYERTGLSPKFPQPVWMLGIIVARGFLTADRLLCRATGGRVVRPDMNGYMDHASALRLFPSWKALVTRTLVSPDSLMYKFGIVRREYVLGLVRGHMSGRRDNREKIHYLITFELILRRYFPEGLGWQSAPG